MKCDKKVATEYNYCIDCSCTALKKIGFTDEQLIAVYAVGSQYEWYYLSSEEKDIARQTYGDKVKNL